jgi:hypothetical protein
MIGGWPIGGWLICDWLTGGWFICDWPTSSPSTSGPTNRSISKWSINMLPTGS